MRAELRRVEWLFPLAVSLHNLEEAVWMPQFWRERGWHFVTATQFRALAVVVAFLAFAVTYGKIRESRIVSYLFRVFCVVMLLNAIWHVSAAIYLRRYAPGVVTAAVLVLPVTIYLIRAET